MFDVLPRPHTLTADFFTNTHRFSAGVAVGNRRLADVLNDQMTDFLEVKDIYVSRLHTPGEILNTYKVAALIKKHITFIVIAVEADALSQEYKYNSPLTRSSEEVFLSVPPFEITGELEMVGKFDLKASLAISTTNFIPILRGTVVNANQPDISFTGPVILVNRTVIEFFSALKVPSKKVQFHRQEAKKLKIFNVKVKDKQFDGERIK